MEKKKMKDANVQIVDEKESGKKSKFWAYIFWLFGGLFGAHHIYLGRDAHAFVYISTFGGYLGLGWLRDIYRIPSYVAEANNDPVFVEEFKRKVRANRKPTFSALRFAAQNAVAYFWAEIYYSAIPQDEIYDINFRHLVVLTPVVVALGVWTVGNIGREKGTIWAALIAAYLVYPTFYYIGDDTTWVFLMVIASSLAFDTFSKQWRLKPRKKRGAVQRTLILILAITLYFSLIGNYLYFNAVITDSEGEEIKLSDAIRHFLTSPIWLDLKVARIEIIRYNNIKVDFWTRLYLSCFIFSGEFGGNLESSGSSRILGNLGSIGGSFRSTRRDKCVQGTWPVSNCLAKRSHDQMEDPIEGQSS